MGPSLRICSHAKITSSINEKKLFTKTGTIDWTRTGSDYWHLNGWPSSLHLSNKYQLTWSSLEVARVSRVCRVAWTQYCGLANGNSSNYRAITLLTLDYVGVNNWPSCSHFDKTLIIGNVFKDYRIPASHSFFLQCPDTHWSSARMSVFLEKSITSDDKSRISALLKTKRTVSCEYPSREIQVVRHRMTDALCNSTISDH